MAEESMLSNPSPNNPHFRLCGLGVLRQNKIPKVGFKGWAMGSLGCL